MSSSAKPVCITEPIGRDTIRNCNGSGASSLDRGNASCAGKNGKEAGRKRKRTIKGDGEKRTGENDYARPNREGTEEVGRKGQ